MTSPDPEIRPFRPGDEAALMEVCLRTGHAGSDASDLFADGNLVGTIWCMPYLVLEPELASVVSLAGGEPSGYVLGALDSAAFRAAAAARYWPAVRERYPIDSFPADSMDALLVHLIHDRSHSAGSDADDAALLAGYPSHLHIDLLPELQGRGLGRRLIERLVDQLAGMGSPGVHLGVSKDNTRAIAFYRGTGFEEWGGDGLNLTFVRRITPR